MRIVIDRVVHEARIRPDVGDPPVRSESALMVAIKRKLQKNGYNVIKKEMAKDGHMVSSGVFYVRSRNMEASGAFAIWDDRYAVRDVARDYREGRSGLGGGKGVDLKLEWTRLPKSGAKIEYIGGAGTDNPGTAATLWARFGDASDYDEYGNDLSALADAFVENGITNGRNVESTGGRGGVSAPGFRGKNYISLFWGDVNADFVRGLTAAELAALRRAIDRAAK